MTETTAKTRFALGVVTDETDETGEEAP